MIKSSFAPRQKKLVSSMIGLSAAVVLLTGCSSGAANQASAGDNGAAESAESSIDGAWIVVEGEGNTGDVVSISGDEFVYLKAAGHDDACPSTKKAIQDIEAGAINFDGDSEDGQYEVESTGTIVDNQTSVIWDDDNGHDGTGEESETGYMRVGSDTIALEYVIGADNSEVTLMPVDSDQGQAAVNEVCE